MHVPSLSLSAGVSMNIIVFGEGNSHCCKDKRSATLSYYSQRVCWKQIYTAMLFLFKHRQSPTTTKVFFYIIIVLHGNVRVGLLFLQLLLPQASGCQ